MRENSDFRAPGSFENHHEAHLPKYLLRLLKNEDPVYYTALPRYVEGAYAFLDISGFTPLSETLSKYGREGTEILTHTISSYFKQALGSIFLWGGDVVKFGGDALTVFFEKTPGEDPLGPLVRACSASLAITETISDFKVETPFGTFSLNLKVGISSGKVLFMVLGDRTTRLEYIFAGDPIDKTAEAEHHASPSQVVLDPSSSGLLKGIADISALEGGFSLLTNMAAQKPPPSGGRTSGVDPVLIKPYLLPSVFEHLEMGNERMLSEHRPVVPCFVSFPSLDFETGDRALLLQDYFLKIAELLRGLGGSFNRMDMGDKGSKFLCFFGAPESYADNEERAVAFALELKALEKQMKWLKGQSVGITSGICYAGVVGSELRREYTVMGDTVNVSARLMGAAKGRILVTRDVRERTRNKFRFSPYRKLALKGKSLEVPVSSPLGISSRGDTEGSRGAGSVFTGRKIELNKLLALVEHSSKPIYISGPPGIGKSELVKQAAESLSNKKWSTTFLPAPISSPHPFYIAGRVFQTVARTVCARQQDLRALEALFPGQADLLPLFSILTNEKMKMTPAVSLLSEGQKIETLSGLFSTLLEKCTHRQLFILEDFDRIGKEEADLFTKVLERAYLKAVKFVMIGRNKTIVGGKIKHLSLGGLPKDEVDSYVLRHFKAKAVPDSLVSFLFERSGGNPLYLKEILSGLKEMNAINCNSEGFVVWNADAASKVSKSIEEILLMRLDNLDYTQKNLVKVASCIGERFGAKTLSEIYVPWTEPEEIARILDGLGHLGIEKQPDGSYCFSSKLLQSVAYESILVSNKRALHSQIAEIIEKRDHGDSAWEILARHFSLGENYAKAFDYAVRSARKAFASSAFYEAQRLYGDAAGFSVKLGKALEELDLLDYSKSLISTGSYDKAGELLNVLRNSPDKGTVLNSRFLQLTILDQKGEYSEEFEESKALFDVACEEHSGRLAVSSLRYAVSSLIRLGKNSEIHNWIEKGYKTALDYEFDDELPNLHVLSGSTRYSQGDFSNAEDYYKMALDSASLSLNYELMIRSYLGISNCRMAAGDPANALGMADKALEMSNKIGSRLNILGAATSMARIHNFISKPGDALKDLIEVGALVDKERFPYPTIMYFNELGIAYYGLGNLSQALKNFRKSLLVAKESSTATGIINAMYNIADIYREIGNKNIARKNLRSLAKDYSKSMDVAFLVKIGKDIMDLSEDPCDRKNNCRFLKRIADSIQDPSIFDEIINH